ncbi:MAG: hypothetical protein M1828_004498 [Chrysothrix sp. TS-e1954]|nr:MAG: hypothetical protein M1828_004498 [Chrysothrix sp. TS-e1954]
MGKHRKPDKGSIALNSEFTNGVKQGGTPSHGKKNHESRFTFQPRPDWHASQLSLIETPPKVINPSTDLTSRLHQHAKSLLEAEGAAYASTHLHSSSSHKFMSTVMSSGTYSDKVSALTLVVQESPLHTGKQLETLVDLAGKHNRTQALMALAAIKDMLSQGALLPGERKLRMFSKQPGIVAALQGVKPSWTAHEPLPNGLTNRHLIFWAFEDQLKHLYFVLLKSLEELGNDQVEYSRSRAVTYFFELLKEKPEQEENLLRLLVNKLGDKSKKVASRASYLLLQLQTFHPSMRSIIIRAIESEILLRPGQDAHAKYYAVITLNQTFLKNGEPDTANKLLDVYFNIFVTVLNKSRHPQEAKRSKNHSKDIKRRKRPDPKAEDGGLTPEQQLDDKIIAQVLTGINRAFHFAKSDGDYMDKHINTMFRIAHSANFNTSIQALTLIQRITITHTVSVDRLMRTLYESLLDPRLLTSSKHTMYLNLLYRSLKSDVNVKRVKAFVKRLLQILYLHDPPFVCSVLYLIHELEGLFPAVKAMLDQPEDNEEDEEERFVDAPDSEDAAPQANGMINGSTPSKANHKSPQAYDGRKRDPEHSNADRTCLWELLPFSAHYHPSVSLLSSRLLHPHPTLKFPPQPDPTSHTLTQFLDRFAYRNAQSSTNQPSASQSSATGPPKTRGTSLMQPALASHNSTDHFFHTTASPSSTQQPFNSEAFWSAKAADVREDEVFFQKYFGEVGPRRKAAQERRKAREGSGKGDVDVDPDDFDEEVGAGEDEIWKALVGSAREEGDEVDVDDDGEDDDEDDLEELEYTDDEDEDVAAEGGVAVPGRQDEDEVGDEDGDGDEASDSNVELNLESDPESDLISDDASASALFSSEEEDEAITATPQALPTQDKRKASADETDAKRAKRRKLRNLPTFASVDEYATMLEGEDDGLGGADGGGDS